MLLAIAAAMSVGAVPLPKGNWIVDAANVIDAPVEARIEASLDAFHVRTKVEIALVTVDDVDREPHAWATDLFNTWGIGQYSSNNGVLVLLVMARHDLEIITGDGITAALPDDWLGTLEDGTMVPRFQAGDVGGGLEAGIAGILDHLAGTTETGVEMPSPAPAPVVAVTPPRRDDSGSGSNLPWFLGGGALLAGVGGAFGVRRWREMQRTCATCKVRMLQLSEIEDDQKLEPGQRKEEALGSVDYEVVVCPGCQASKIFRHAKWFSSYCKCDACGFKTATRTTTTLVQATYDHGGQIRIRETCQQCSHVAERTRFTSARTRPSTTHSSSSSFSSGSSGSSGSSSSSHHSSFGGGHSSGHGHSSHW